MCLCCKEILWEKQTTYLLKTISRYLPTIFFPFASHSLNRCDLMLLMLAAIQAFNQPKTIISAMFILMFDIETMKKNLGHVWNLSGSIISAQFTLNR